MIKVAHFSFDDDRIPSSIIRVIAPNALLRSKVAMLSAHVVSGNRIHQDPAALDTADIALVQRGFPRRATERICESILRSGKPVIYETDDALKQVPTHHNKPIYNNDVGPAVDKFVKHVDLITVATPALAEVFRASAKRTLVLANYLSPELWTAELAAPTASVPNRVRIGFVGSTNHARDFATVVPLLKEALARYPHVEIVSYGGLSDGLEGLPRFSMMPSNYDYTQHPRRLCAAGIDIAIVPLTPSRFNRCKSNIKFLEFGFLGIPGVFADLEPYRDSVIHAETGFLCDAQPVSWRESLFTLIEDTNLRARMGKAAQAAVRSLWMLDAHKEEWLRAYDLAAKIRSARRR